MAHHSETDSWSPEALVGIRQHEPISSFCMFLWAAQLLVFLFMAVVGWYAWYGDPGALVWQISYIVIAVCLLLFTSMTNTAKKILRHDKCFSEEEQRGHAIWCLLKAYWRRNVRIHYVTFWRHDGKIHAEFHHGFPWFKRDDDTACYTCVTVPFGGWFAPRYGKIVFRGHYGTCYIENQRYRVHRAQRDAILGADFAVVLEDDRGTRLPLTVKYALDLLDMWENGQWRVDPRFDILLISYMRLAKNLQEKFEAAQQARFDQEVLLLDVARRIAESKRFGRSKEGAAIRAWLDNELLKALPESDARRREVETRITGVVKKAQRKQPPSTTDA